MARRSRKTSAPEIENRVRLLEERLDYHWRQREMLFQALRHPSSTADGRRANRLVSNQRLEFLGDSVLDIIVGMHLMEMHPNEGEGFLASTRAAMVNRKTLAARAKELHLDRLVEVEVESEYLKVIDSTMADCFEAVIGSAFLDGGCDLVVIRRIIRNTGVLG